MDFLKNNRFLLFLILLLARIVVLPFITHKFWSGFLSTVNYSLILILGMYAFSASRYFIRITAVLFLAAITVEWIDFFTPPSNFSNSLRPFTTSMVLILLLVMTMRQIRLERTVDRNVIFAALSGYVLIGYIGALLATGISLAYPGAYNADLSTGMEALYFSFVTMTTLGYGEILPLLPQSKALTILLCILGPMFVATLLALIVSKYSSESGK